VEDEVADVVPVLDIERLIEPKARADVLDLLWCSEAPCASGSGFPEGTPKNTEPSGEGPMSIMRFPRYWSDMSFFSAFWADCLSAKRAEY